MPDSHPSTDATSGVPVTVTLTEQQVELLTRIRDDDFNGMGLNEVLLELLRRQLVVMGESGER